MINFKRNSAFESFDEFIEFAEKNKVDFPADVKEKIETLLKINVKDERAKEAAEAIICSQITKTILQTEEHFLNRLKAVLPVVINVLLGKA